MRRSRIPVSLALLAVAATALFTPVEAQGAPRQEAGEVASPQSDLYAADRELLASGTPAEKALAIDRLLSSADRAVLPILSGALIEEDRDLRTRITLGLLRTFPADAATIFFGLLEAEELPRREAAIFALGLIDHPESVPRLVAALGSPEEKLRHAAARSLSIFGRNAYLGAYVRATGEPRPVVPRERERLVAVRSAICADLLANGVDPLRRPLLERFADRDLARSLRAAFLEARPDDPAAAQIGALAQKLERWTPRSSLAAGLKLSYTISIENLVAKSTKRVPISIGADDFEALHYHRYSLDRALHLQLPLDELLLDPERCSPRRIEAPEGDERAEATISIGYRLPERTDLRCGIGILNIAYWEGATFDGREVELLIDSASGLPKSERVTDSSGETVFQVRYSDWLDLGEGAAAPGAIQIEMPKAQIGAQVLPMRYELRFRLHDGIWLLDGAEAFARAETGEEMRAIATISEVSVVRAESGDAPLSPAPGGGADEPSPPPAGTTGESAPGSSGTAGSGSGASTGEPGSHGSRGDSPRS